MAAAFFRRKQIHAMHRLYGEDVNGLICADCPHLVEVEGHFACTLYGVEEWQKKWQACGLIDHDPDFESWIPVSQRLWEVKG